MSEGSSFPSIAAVTVELAEALARGDILFVARDDARAERIGAALASIMPGHTVVVLPASDTLPGDDAPATAANAGRRVAALRRLRVAGGTPKRDGMALVTSAEAAAAAVPPPDAFDAEPPAYARGDAIDLAAITDAFAALGYVADDRVDEPGEIAVRGEVIDVFPADTELPVRIEVAGGTVASIRAYDPISQRTVHDLDRVEVGRASEPPLHDGVPLTAHLPGATIALDPGVGERGERFLALAADAGARRGRPPRGLVDEAAWSEATRGLARREIAADAALPPRFAERRAPLAAFKRWATPLREGGSRIVLAGSARDLRFLVPRIVKALGVTVATAGSWLEVTAAKAGSVAAVVMPVAEGLVRDDLALVTAAELLGSRALVDDAASPSGAGSLLGALPDLRVGDVVVHEDHGIARVAGLEAMPGEAGDAIVLEHAEGARRLVPVDTADRLWRYGANADAVALDKLDGTSWLKRRAAINEAVEESARQLTEIAAERATREAPAFVPDAAAYERFGNGFGFTETPDQARAINAVRQDLAAGKPMDRLVVGDVGYGKTEVALRAAALVALAGGQVAIAAPTTVLVRQHLELARQRFAGTGIEVAGYSRLSSAAEKKAVKAGVADGSIGVVVGTGGMAGLPFESLGLVVIDEEQRFGAADKAKLRGQGDAHLLTMSATPIPRTLQSALVGLQPVSVIATPPARRQPIRTTVDAWDDVRVRTALLREKARGGQSFVVVPRIEDMEEVAARLTTLAPELEVTQAHGKLPAAEIDAAMVAFAGGRGDVLLATNIIEAGLDVPRANTMMVWRADRFGLAQLHQLRGRVGRGSRRGQVLLLTDGEAAIVERTLKRLRTLEAFDRLGAGFEISARDLDMRGAGDLLGEAQAGHTKLIGVDLYQHLFETALRTARGETVERWTPDLHLGLDGRLSAAWIPEEEVRVTLYARLARIGDAGALGAFEEELEDRFGALPADAEALLHVARIRVLARMAGIGRIDAGPGAIAITPRPGVVIDAAAHGLAAKDDRLILSERIDDPAERAERLATLLEAIGGES